MGEKSVRVEPGEFGSYVAARDALALDEDLNPRIIQLVDVASRRIESWFAMRGTSLARITENDDNNNFDLFAPAEGLMAVGDATTLVLLPKHYNGEGSIVDLTPVVYTPGGAKSILETKRSTITLDMRDYDGVTYWRPGPLLSWDLLGAHQVQVFISGITTNSVWIEGALI
jgi:hypothetical protein